MYGVSDEELGKIADEIGCRDDALNQKAILINTEIFSDEEIELKMLKKFKYQAGDFITIQYNDATEITKISLAAVTDRRIFSCSGTSQAVLVVGEEYFEQIFGNTLSNIKFF